MYRGYLTDIKGIKVGHAEDKKGGTGVTVVVPPAGNKASVDVRGGGPGTRECVLLNPTYAVDEVHAIVLSGGSAFGLEAASGVMRALEEDGRGFDVGVDRVPIVPSAVLFDLAYGDPKARPDMAMGRKAYENASREEQRQGIVGAGTGATVAKTMGEAYAKKSGLGSATIRCGELIFSALVAVNAFGHVFDAETGEVLAAPEVEGEALSVEAALNAGEVDFQSGKHKNTTLAVVATNATLTKTELSKLASISHNGYARSIVPVHTGLDGDTIFTLATGEVEGSLQLAEYYMPKVVARAVANAVRSVSK